VTIFLCMFCAVDGGWVRYSVIGSINGPGLSRNLRTKMLFKVLDVLDLNFVPNARVRVFTVPVACCKGFPHICYLRFLAVLPSFDWSLIVSPILNWERIIWLLSICCFKLIRPWCLVSVAKQTFVPPCSTHLLWARAKRFAVVAVPAVPSKERSMQIRLDTFLENLFVQMAASKIWGNFE